MARNGSGTYTLPPSNPVVSGTVIESEWANDTMADIAAALTQSIAYNGETVPIANLPMGGFHHTSVSDPTARNQYATLGMVQDGRHQRVQGLTGVDNLVGTLVGGATAYVAGASISFFVPANNTGAMTLNYNGIGAKSLVSSAGLPLTAGQLKANDFVMAYYDGVQFKILSNITATVATTILALSTTGQERPGGGAFAPMTIATGTSINIPAGKAWIVPPNSDSPDDATEVSWATQALTLTFLATSFTTTIAVNNFGQIVQFAGRTIGANLRDCAILGVVEHITGVANKVITKPTIFADDGYRGTDMASLLTNTIINGALITPNGVSPLQLDISAGSIFMPGGDANTIKSPNVYPIPQQGNIQFRPMAGQNTVGAVISNAPVGSYDPNGAGVVTVIPNNADTVIHRLYFLYGAYIWVYGQKIYTSVENALSMIEWDRTQYKPSIFLMDATLIGEIIAIKNTTALSNIAQAAIVAPGGINFSIGSPGGISEAPIDGTPYGRQDAAWTKVLRQTAPTALTSFTVNGATPSLSQVQNPAGPGTVALFHNSGANRWFTIETVNPDDKTYLRSYNPSTNALRFTTTYNLANGVWTFPATPIDSTFGNMVSCPQINSVDGGIPIWNGTSGHNLKQSSIVVGGASLNELNGVVAINGGPVGGLRNKLINGDFGLFQRGTSRSSDGFLADRWQFIFAAVGATLASGARFSLLPSGAPVSEFRYALSVTATTGTAAPLIRQAVEQVETLAGQPFTASVWVYNNSGAVRNIGLDLVQYFGSSGSPQVDVQSPAIAVPVTVWTRVVFSGTLPAILGKTIAGGNDCLIFDIQLLTPSASQTIIFAGAQLEYGSVPTPFEHRPIAMEQAMCERYYEKGQESFTGYTSAGSGYGQCRPFRVLKRTTPTMTWASTTTLNIATPTVTATAEHINNSATAVTTGVVVNAGNWTASAELPF